MTRRLSFSAAVAVVVAGLLPIAGFTQTDPRGKSYTLFGTVEGINEFAQSIRINQEKIKGYSEATIAIYSVDDPAILKKLEIGDQITGTIYEKDKTLYNIRVAVIYDPVIPQRYR